MPAAGLGGRRRGIGIGRHDGDHFHLGDATVRASDATGLENENVWNALARKGLIKCEWPNQIALTPSSNASGAGRTRDRSVISIAMATWI